MAVTLALAYGDRGDIGQAVRICRRAISKAETLDSAMARAAAYWNASIFESERGSVSNAVAMAERALTLLSEGQDARNLARLRSQIGNLQLELDPPAVADARQHLEKAAEELPWSGASPVEIAQNRLLQARAHLLGGDLDVADSMCQEAMEVATSDTPGFAASARAVLGQIHAARGDTEGAKTLFRQAVYFLTGAGADRDAAQLWFELADLLEGVGDLDAAREAYRSAAASTGLRSRPKTQGSTTDVRSTSHAGAF
jgi:tetratricopeptide (TPR) repeat protein